MASTKKETKSENKVAPVRKPRIELLKTIALTAVIVGLIAFCAGVHYESNVNASRQQAITQALKAKQ